MTVRAVTIGILLGLVVASFGYANDWILGQAYVASDLIPVSVYGLLVLGLLTVNPLMRLTGRGRFKAGEWCVIASLMLAACVIPGPGLMWHFSNSLVMPHHSAKTKAAWEEFRLLEYLPKIMLADPGGQYEKVVEGFSEGLSKKDRLIPIGDVPWGAWTRTLSFWLPLLGLSFVAGICLVLVVHRQWAHRERLRYPVADFAAELVRGAGDRPLPAIFYNRRFWLGFAAAAGIMLVNGYSVWNRNFINIPMGVDLTPFRTKWPLLEKSPYWGFLLAPTFFFAGVGFAYFLSSEVSFSLGISQFAYTMVFLVLTYSFGIELTSSYFLGGPRAYSLFGAYLGVALMVFYGGRRFYFAVLRNALFVGGRTPCERQAVWACRVALLAAGAIVVILVVVVRLHWLLAVMFVMLTGLLFLVITRISVEAGLFFVQPFWHAIGIILGLFGAAALGSNMIVILGMLSLLTTIDPRVCLMPLIANALRFSESGGVRPSRLSAWMILSVLLALVVGVPATLHFQYSYGGSRYTWPNSTAEEPFRAVEQNLDEIGGSPDHWQEFRPDRIRLDRSFLYPTAIGLALALSFSWLRLRYTWWPIHPVIFLVWGTFPMGCVAASFLLGWVIKVMISKFGGGRSYQNNKPFFVGLIAGEFLAGIFWMIVGLLYRFIEGVPGPMFRVHP